MKYKKLFVALIFAGAFLITTPAHAFIALPFFDVTINQHATGGDGNFTFHISSSTLTDPEANQIDDFDIQTASGSGSHLTNAIAGTGDIFSIVQDPLSGWQAPTVVCTSPDPAVTSDPTEGGVQVKANSFSSVTCDFTNTKATTTEASNVLFIPGFEGSRLYKTKGGVLNIEDQLWEPNISGDVVDLSMDENGTSKNNKIYTRDIIDTTNVYKSAVRIYQNLNDSLDKLVADNTITSWAAVPYDWRYDPQYTVTHGITDNTGHISYENELSANQTPFIISQLEALIATSKTGKVTIVTHSNGGLVVKALIEKLQAMHVAGQNDDIDKIDKIIMIAAPQTGTPDAIGGLLNGIGTAIGKGRLTLVSKSIMRNFGQNMPGAYSLLPSQKYFDTVMGPVITFDPSLDSVNNFHKKYGDSITTYAGMKNFLLGILDQRTQPDSSDVTDPTILNASLLNSASSIHADIDNYQYPSTIQVHKIAGWGQSTVSGIQYTTKSNCVGTIAGPACSLVLDEKPMYTVDGDATVVTPSATNGDGTKYYFNLAQYNTDNKKNYKHSDIFESDKVFELVQNILTGDNTLSKYVTVAKPSSSNNLVLSTHSPVSLDVYDSGGRHTGLAATELPTDPQQVDEEIPNSSYLPFGEGTYTTIPTGENYDIKISGTDFGTFTFQKEQYVNDQPEITGALTFADIPVTPTTEAKLTITPSGDASALTLDIDGDGTTDATISPGAEFDPILYLEMMKKTVLSMNLASNTERVLLNKIDILEKAIQKGKIKNAKIKIKTLMTNIQLRHGHRKHIDESDKQALIGMFNQLLDNLN